MRGLATSSEYALETLEHGMTLVDVFAITRTGVRLAESIGFRPVLEMLSALPDRMSGVQGVVLSLRASKQMEFLEAWNFFEITVPLFPYAFELRFLAPLTRLPPDGLLSRTKTSASVSDGNCICLLITMNREDDVASGRFIHFQIHEAAFRRFLQ